MRDYKFNKRNKRKEVGSQVCIFGNLGKTRMLGIQSHTDHSFLKCVTPNAPSPEWGYRF